MLSWYRACSQKNRGNDIKLIKTAAHKIGRLYVNPVNKREYENQKLHINERPIEYRFVLEHLSHLSPKAVLDVGVGQTAFPSVLRHCGFVVTATDNINDYWPKGMFNRHFYVRHDNITNTALTEKFDFISCISVLEHIPDHEAALDSMFKLLNPGGRIALTFPYNENEFIENAYDLPDAGYGKGRPYVCQIFSRSQVDEWIGKNRAQVEAQEFWRVFTGEYWTVGERLPVSEQVSRTDQHQLTCLLLKSG